MYSTRMKLVSIIYCVVSKDVHQVHTYISGNGLTLQHIRYNSECDVYEELEPIERNLGYDFNFQQINHLPREVIVKPVS